MVPGWAGIGREYLREQGVSPPACGDFRARAGASGDVLRDVRGMRLLSQLQTAGMAGYGATPLDEEGPEIK